MSTYVIETLDNVISRIGGGASSMVSFAADDDTVPTLDQMLAAKQKVPSSTSVVVTPTTLSDDDAASLQNLRLLEAYISAAASAIIYKARPQGWNIGNPADAFDFNQQSADAQFRVITEGLPSVLNFGPSSSQSFTKDVTTADLHLEFLNGLFGDFGFAPADLKQLDSILTNVVNDLGALQMSFSDQSETLNHVISFHYSEPVMGSTLRDWKLRLFYLKVAQNSWTASVGKSSVAHIHFDMNYFENTSSLNDEQLTRNADTIQTYIDTLTKQGFAAIEALTTPKAISSDVTPGGS